MKIIPIRVITVDYSMVSPIKEDDKVTQVGYAAELQFVTFLV